MEATTNPAVSSRQRARLPPTPGPRSPPPGSATGGSCARVPTRPRGEGDPTPGGRPLRRCALWASERRRGRCLAPQAEAGGGQRDLARPSPRVCSRWADPAACRVGQVPVARPAGVSLLPVRTPGGRPGKGGGKAAVSPPSRSRAAEPGHKGEGWTQGFVSARCPPAPRHPYPDSAPTTSLRPPLLQGRWNPLSTRCLQALRGALPEGPRGTRPWGCHRRDGETGSEIPTLPKLPPSWPPPWGSVTRALLSGDRPRTP